MVVWNTIVRIAGYAFMAFAVIAIGFWSWVWLHPEKPLQFTKGAPMETVTDAQGRKIPLLPDGTPAFNYGEKPVDNVKPPAKKEPVIKVTETKDGESEINFSAKINDGRNLSVSIATDDATKKCVKGDGAEVKAEAVSEQWSGKTLQRKVRTKSSSIRKAEVEKPKPVQVAAVAQKAIAASTTVSVAPVVVSTKTSVVASPCKGDCEGERFVLPAPRDQNR